jgi:hypothetical protein
MLMKTPAAILDAQALDDRLPEGPAPAAKWREALGFAIAFLLWALFAYASVKYGIVLPDVMN